MVLMMIWPSIVPGEGLYVVSGVSISRVSVSCVLVSHVSYREYRYPLLFFFSHFLGSFFKACPGKVSWLQQQLQPSKE